MSVRPYSKLERNLVIDTLASGETPKVVKDIFYEVWGSSRQCAWRVNLLWGSIQRILSPLIERYEATINLLESRIDELSEEASELRKRARDNAPPGDQIRRRGTERMYG